MTNSAEVSAAERFPHLERPPISEVICGLVFPAVRGLDAFEFGVYWNERRSEYPGRRIQPAITEGLTFTPDGVQPVRAWLVSPNEGELLQQIQADRFYMNWRRRGNAYPRFSDPKAGPTKGLKSIALAEFARLVEFCERRETIAGKPEPIRIELAKIDTLQRGRDWTSPTDLAALLPITAAFIELSTSEGLSIALQVQEPFEGGVLSVRINSASDVGGVVSSIRLETRISLTLSETTIDAAFTKGNARLNKMFFRLIPEAQMRFGSKD